MTVRPTAQSIVLGKTLHLIADEAGVSFWTVWDYLATHLTGISRASIDVTQAFADVLLAEVIARTPVYEDLRRREQATGEGP